MTSEELDCAVAARITNDGKYVGAVSFKANTVAILKRDADTGKLTPHHVVTGGDLGAESLDFPIELAFSQDSKFVYVAGMRGINAFRLEDGKLKPIQEVTDDTTSSGRSIVVSPDNKYVYGGFKGSNSLVVLKRDLEKGTLTTVQTLVDEDGATTALQGISYVACSPDSKFVYTNSGRFGGDKAVAVFKREDKGTLKVVQELFEGEGLDGLDGGNEIGVTPDGSFVYALASNSDKLLRLQRDKTTGKLKQIGAVTVGDPISPGAAGLCFSKDSVFCYVADEKASAIVTYKHVTGKKK